MSNKSPSLLVAFSYLPWWASVVAGIVVYIGLNYVLPALVSDNQILVMVVAAGKHVAIWFSLLFLIPAVSSIFRRRKRKQLVEHQASIQTLRETSWSDFEVLVGEVFRRKGFTVQENMTGGADGGIDLLLLKDGEHHIVQCKQWRKSKVGVPIVREMFGVLKASSAITVYVVISGHFTKEAITFAAELPITLIDGDQLLALTAEVQSSENIKSVSLNSRANQCPKCNSELVKRVAKKGAQKGNEFLGCSSFPKCRYIQN
jgi:restriction system protein